MHYFLLPTFLELPQFVVTVEEDDEGEEVDEEEADHGGAGDSGPVFTDLVVLPPRTETPPGPASLLLHRGRQPLPHSPGDVLTKVGDREDHGLSQLLEIAPPGAGADVREVGLDAESVCLAVAVLARLGQVNRLQNIRAGAGLVVVVVVVDGGGGGFHLLIGSL